MYTQGDNQWVGQTERFRKDSPQRTSRRNVNRYHLKYTISHSNFKSYGTSGIGPRILNVMRSTSPLAAFLANNSILKV